MNCPAPFSNFHARRTSTNFPFFTPSSNNFSWRFALGIDVPEPRSDPGTPASADMDHISKLPTEVLCEIVKTLTSLDDLHAFLSTSKNLHDTCIDLSMHIPVDKSADIRNTKHYLNGSGVQVLLELACPSLAVWALESDSNK